MLKLLAQLGTGIDIGPLDNPTLPDNFFVEGWRTLVGGLTVSLVGGKIEGLVSSMIGLMTIIAGIVLTVMFVYGAIVYMTAGSDKAGTEKGLKIISHSIVGIVIVVLAVALAGVVGKIVGLDNILAPAWTSVFGP